MTLARAKENPNILQTVSLLTAYCFDLRGLAPTQLTNEWLSHFSDLWIRLAVIEALYLGRYKAISVEHLLQFWQVKGQPTFHFSPEFERMISKNLPKSLTPLAETVEVKRPVDDSLDQPHALKVPGVIKQSNSLPLPTLSDGTSQEIGMLSGSLTASAPPTPEERLMTPTRRSAPSIEQFIPITAESDLLSKLQSVLHQGAMPLEVSSS